MSKKAIISVDIAGCVGTMRYVPGVPLPRDEKQRLERVVSEVLLTTLSANGKGTFADIESAVPDPPDVTFTFNGERLAMELVELLPPNRLEKDCNIVRLKRDIIAALHLGAVTRDWVANVHLHNDYTEFRPGRIGAIIAEALNEFLSSERAKQDTKYPNSLQVPLPPKLQPKIARISCFREDLTGDPRIQARDEPLIVFGAECTMLVPEDDCPEMVATQLMKKAMHDLDQPTWLLVWSSHHALSGVRDELNASIRKYLAQHPMKYEKIFHLHLFPGSTAVEFPTAR